MKLQGFSGAGKTHFYLTMFSDLAKGRNPDEASLCIIDCDMEGQADLIGRDSIVPEGLRPTNLPKGVYARRSERHGSRIHWFTSPTQSRAPRWCSHGCLGERRCVLHRLSQSLRWIRSRNGEADLLLARQQQALREGKKTLPTFEEGQMHSYKVINRLFITPYEQPQDGCGDVWCSLHWNDSHEDSHRRFRNKRCKGNHGIEPDDPTLPTLSLIGFWSFQVSNESRLVNYRFATWFKSRSQERAAPFIR